MAAELAQRFQVYHAQQDTTKRFDQSDAALHHTQRAPLPSEAQNIQKII